MSNEIFRSPERNKVKLQLTVVLIKPESVQRGLVGEIIKRFENKGLNIKALKMTLVNRELAERHYDVHREKPFFGELVNHITSSPLIAVVLEGYNSIEAVRNLIGSTDPLKAQPGTIRHDYALAIDRNIVHASDSPESADTEIKLWFGELFS